MYFNTNYYNRTTTYVFPNCVNNYLTIYQSQHILTYIYIQTKYYRISILQGFFLHLEPTINITCILHRLRQESEVLSRASSSHWSGSVCSSSASNLNSATAASTSDNTGSESTSSSETLKWLGSMSDVSVSSHATSSSAVSASGNNMRRI